MPLTLSLEFICLSMDGEPVHSASQYPLGKNLTLSPSSFFCSIAWPHYKVGKGEVWAVNGNIKFDIILQLTCFLIPKELNGG